MLLDTMPCMSTPKRAFISHSTANDSYVAELESFLRRLGYTSVFNDVHSIQPDERFWPAIEQGIREHDDLIVVITTASATSEWVRREIELARSLNKTIVPIWIEDCVLPATFADRDVIDFRPSNRTKLIQRLSAPRFIHHAAEHFLGREPQLALIDEAWASGTNVLSIIAWGGVGKTSLITEWVQSRFIDKQWKTEGGQLALAAYFDWTFYDQGTRSLADGTEARTGSVGDFFEKALVFFGDPDPNFPGKGRRLADLIRQQRSLIILDGLEPLQQPPGHPQAGRLLDPDLRDCLASLAQSNPGLCLITSRQALTDLHSLRRTVHTEHELEDLPVSVAIRLLRQLQIKGTDQELAQASEKFGCHALSVTLLGRYLSDAHGGDIARTDRIRDLQRADTLTREDRHRSAWRILDTYESWLSNAQADGNPKTLAVLRLAGLFDRTATADCLASLRAAPIIPGLTDAICGMADDEWNILLKRLERAHLIKLRESSNLKLPTSDCAWAVDAHPLIREYFAHHLRCRYAAAWQNGHSRLFDYLCDQTEYRPPTIESLAPLFQAVTHGCQASRHQEALLKVYLDRIERGVDHENGYYCTTKLGATGSCLETLALFFNEDWTRIDQSLRPPEQLWLLGQTINLLCASGRLTEGMKMLQAYLIHVDGTVSLKIAALTRLSSLESLFGNLDDAIDHGREAIDLSSQNLSSGGLARMNAKETTASALNLTGHRQEAASLYNDIYNEWKFMPPSFEHSSFCLDYTERQAWQTAKRSKLWRRCVDDCAQAELQAKETIERGDGLRYSLISVALAHLTLARISLYQALHRKNMSLVARFLNRRTLAISPPTEAVEKAVFMLRKSHQYPQLPLALLTAAFYQGTLGENLEEAERLLEEAQQIAERGPMPLHLADVHLHRARLFGRLVKNERERKFPHIVPKAELAEARRLIEKHGYWRRKEELEAAEAAAIDW
jgi:tetratricopeptide (TPR) repeat protein